MDEQGLTRRQALGLGTAAAAAGAMALVPGIAGAATTQDTRATITTAEAQALLAAAEMKANEIGVPMYVVIVDESAKPKASLRMDGASLASLTLVPPKAVTAASFRTPTHVLAERVAADPVRSLRSGHPARRHLLQLLPEAPRPPGRRRGRNRGHRPCCLDRSRRTPAATSRR